MIKYILSRLTMVNTNDLAYLNEKGRPVWIWTDVFWEEWTASYWLGKRVKVNRKGKCCICRENPKLISNLCVNCIEILLNDNQTW